MDAKSAVILARVSTETQDYIPQTKELISYARTKGFVRFHKIETKESGFKELNGNGGFNSLKDFLEKNTKYKTVFVTEISRIARRQSILLTIKEYFVKNKIQLYIKDKDYTLLDENGNTDSNTDILFTLYGYFAESEMQQKKERFNRSKRALAKEGYSISGKRLFGYDRTMSSIGKSTYVVNEKEANEIKIIYDWYLNGIDGQPYRTGIKNITLECIAKGFSSYTHSKRNMNKLLKEAAYTGYKITNNKRLNSKYDGISDEPKYVISSMEIKYPVILSEEIYLAVQNRLKCRNTTAEKSTKHTTILSKLIICTECGHYYKGEYRVCKKKGCSKNFYSCSHTKSINGCHNKQSISMTILDSVVWQAVSASHQFFDDRIDKYSDEVSLKGIELEKEISSLKERIDNLDNLIDVEGNIYRISVKSGKNKDEAEYKYMENINKLRKEQNDINKLVNTKQSQIDNFVKSQKTYAELYNTDIETIKKDKALVKFYINQFVEKVVILFSSKNYTVVRLNYKSSLIEHIIINKRATLYIKVRYLRIENVDASEAGVFIENKFYDYTSIFNYEKKDTFIECFKNPSLELDYRDIMINHGFKKLDYKE